MKDFPSQVQILENESVIQYTKTFLRWAGVWLSGRVPIEYMQSLGSTPSTAKKQIQTMTNVAKCLISINIS